MSEDVHYRGTLRKINTKDPKKYAEVVLKGHEIPDYYKDKLEYLLSEEEFVMHNDILYKIESKHSICPYNGFFRAKQMDENYINYDVKYYNGGCGFIEAIEEALDNLELEKE